MENWDEELDKMNSGKVGRPYLYPQTFMQFLAFLHVAFLPLRQMEGFLRKLSEYIPRLKVVDYSTICKRLKKLNIKLPGNLGEIKLPGNLGEDLVVAIDSSGIKVTDRGEWIRHKWKTHKGWIKVHIAVDTKTKKLLALEITDERTGDGKMLKPVIEQIKGRGGGIARVYADGGYDSKENFNYLADNDIEPVIKTRKDASTQARGSPSRAKKVREVKELGYEAWRDKYKFGFRWTAETFFSGVKMTFGERVRARTVEGLFKLA